ncbi:hypothetical protein L596_001944 [Steinernema carpocapsae]|uniref:Uncharacterized protein n=1 Tax=Steinernema carpocapsae TaxID=34508 RepID=A0A4U8UMK3_STECR|nr:hypothetical protein L596_001944 [Steinernema carpocapsae]
MLSESQHRNCYERHFGQLLATKNSSGQLLIIFRFYPRLAEEDHEIEPATTSRIDEKMFFLVEWTQLQQLLQLARCPTCRKRLIDEGSSPNVHRKGSAIVVRCSCEIWKWSIQSQVQGVAVCSGDFALSVGCYTTGISYSRRFTVALTFASTWKKTRSLKIATRTLNGRVRS